METMTCKPRNHKRTHSEFPFDAVPKSMFMKPNGSLYKMCLDCRKHWEANRVKNADKKKRELQVDETKQYCTECHHEKTNEPEFKMCLKCRTRFRKYTTFAQDAYYALIHEYVRKLGVCCEICRKVFLKNTFGEGFIVVDSLDGVNMEDIEVLNLEFDHLTQEEQMLKHGKYYGHKIKGVRGLKTTELMKKEAKKCQLTCLMCHVKETKRRYKGAVLCPSYMIKYDYTNNIKILAGCCQVCKSKIDHNVLAYYEFDHIERSTKIAAISEMCNNNWFTLDDVKAEIPSCQVLCRFCHRQKSRAEAKVIRESKKINL